MRGTLSRDSFERVGAVFAGKWEREGEVSQKGKANKCWTLQSHFYILVVEGR